MKVCLTVALCGNGFDGGGGGGERGGNCSLLNAENCASLWENPGYDPDYLPRVNKGHLLIFIL